MQESKYKPQWSEVKGGYPLNGWNATLANLHMELNRIAIQPKTPQELARPNEEHISWDLVVVIVCGGLVAADKPTQFLPLLHQVVKALFTANARPPSSFKPSQIPTTSLLPGSNRLLTGFPTYHRRRCLSIIVPWSPWRRPRPLSSSSISLLYNHYMQHYCWQYNTTTPSIRTMATNFITFRISPQSRQLS